MMGLVIDVLDRPAVSPVKTPSDDVALCVTFLARRVRISCRREGGSRHNVHLTDQRLARTTGIMHCTHGGGGASNFAAPMGVRNARQGLRALRPTRPAGRGLHSAGPPRGGTDTGRPPGLCTLARSRGTKAPGLRPGKPVGLPQGTRRAKTVFVVTVRRHVVVATGRADVRRLIVERAAPQHAACRWPPSGGR